MRRIAILLSVMLAYTIAAGQEIEYVDDESCGCSLVFVDGIQTTQDGEYFGFKRADGTVIVPNIYRYVDSFHGNYCKVFDDESRCGLIDRDGNLLIPCRYTNMEYPSCGRVLVVRDGLFGFCNLKGEEVIPATLHGAGSFSEDLAQALIVIDSFEYKCTYIDTNGQQVFPPAYDNVMPFNEGYAPVFRYQRWGLIDKSGHEVLPCIYEVMMPNDKGRFFAGDPYGMAMFDYSFKPITKFEYSGIGRFNDGRVMVQRDGKYGFLAPDGHEAVPCIYDDVLDFHQGRAMVTKDGRYGIIDTNGGIVLPIEYENKTTHGNKYVYYDSLALVEKDGKLGFVDLDGNIKIPLYFDQAYHFSQGLACVRHNGGWGYINTKGDIFVPFIFEYASPFQWGRAEVIYNGTVSNMDLRGKCVKNCNGVIAWRDWTKE